MIKNNKQKVAVLGATGVVGQVFVHMLSSHKWFELSVIMAILAGMNKAPEAL